MLSQNICLENFNEKFRSSIIDLSTYIFLFLKKYQFDKFSNKKLYDQQNYTIMWSQAMSNKLSVADPKKGSELWQQQQL